jgi:ABC-type branched-subunit amino acid transport system permease subunit
VKTSTVEPGTAPHTDTVSAPPASSAVASRAAGLRNFTDRLDRRLERLRRGHSWTELRLPILCVVLAVGGFLLLPDDFLYAGATALSSGVIGIGLFFPMATLRELSLNAAGLAGVSAYTYAHLASSGTASKGVGGIINGLIVAVLAVMSISVIGGLAALVVTGLYFLVASLVIQAAIEKVAFSISGFTGGAAGWFVPQPDLGTGWFDTSRAVYLIVAAVTLAATWITYRVLRSRFGMHATVVGQVPEGATAVGLRNWLLKLSVFAYAGALIALGGILLAFSNGTPPATARFGLVWSVIYLAIPIASGLKDLSGVLLMAVIFTVTPIVIEPWNVAPNLVSGMILLVATILGFYRGRWWTIIRDTYWRIRGVTPAAATAAVEGA